MQKKVLKIGGLIITLLIVIFLLVPLFLPSTLVVREQMTADADVRLAFRQVNIISNWSYWNPFEDEDPKLVSFYHGPKMGEGAIHRWESSKLGNGEMRIAESNPYSYIRCELDFDNSGTALNVWRFEALQNSTLIQWEIEIKELSYPFGRIAGLFLPGILKPMMQQGLDNLNSMITHQADPLEIIEIEVPPIASICLADSALYGELRPKMQKGFDQLFQYARISGIGLAGHPFAVLPGMPPDSVILYRLGLPVWEEVRESSPISYEVFPAMNALMATHYGAHEKLLKLHEDILLYLTENDYNQIADPIEQYIKGPHNETDTTKWITEVMYGIK